MLPFPYVILDLETTGGTPLHDRINYWCHLGTVDNEEADLDVLGTRSSMKFDFDTYKLLLKTLGKQTKVITFGVE